MFLLINFLFFNFLFFNFSFFIFHFSFFIFHFSFLIIPFSFFLFPFSFFLLIFNFLFLFTFKFSTHCANPPLLPPTVRRKATTTKPGTLSPAPASALTSQITLFFFNELNKKQGGGGACFEGFLGYLSFQNSSWVGGGGGGWKREGEEGKG